jgi:UDP-glucose:(heptosyl)LPS alpha-1,3-glucosyltransferase
LKIALIRQKYSAFGGAERYMQRLVSGLGKAGHQVHILASQWETDESLPITFHQVHALKQPAWLKALTFSLNCRKIIDAERFDVVFSLERTLKQDVYRAGDGCHQVWLTQKNIGKNILYKAWTWLNPVQRAYLFLERRLFRDPQLKAIIANSRRGKEDIVRLYGVSPEKVHVIYNGIDPVVPGSSCRGDLKREFSVGDDERMLLYVGSGFNRKGVPCLIEAVARLTTPFRLFVVGKGNSSALVRKASRLGIGDKVIFTGPQKDLNRFYQGCDLFVFPTRYDPFSNATLEAMASGLPVITSSFNGVSELIENGKSGYILADLLDPAELASVIERHFRNPDSSSIGKEASRTASGYTMERNVEETLAVIKGVAEA